MIAWKLNSFGILALATANAVCAEPLLVTSTTPLGLQPDGRYHVQLQGSFDSPADVVPTAICDGKPVPSVMHAATQTMIEISIPLQRVPLLCSFIAHRLTDGAISLPSIQITSSGDNQIRGSVDRGRIGTKHGMELYGSFPDPQSLNLSIYCVQGGDINRTTMPYTAEIQFDLRSPTQINLTFNDVPGVGARCSFTPIDASGRATGPLWGPIALSSNDSYITANFGAYHWPLGAAVGPDADDALMPGQQWLARAGFNIARVWMSPLLRTRISNAANPYHLNLDVFAQECPVVPQPCTPGSDCNASPTFLPCAARSSAYQKLLSLPNLGYIIITTADSASSGDFGTQPKLADPSWIQIAANRAKVVREYRDLALALYETQRNSGKHFIVSSWETDNAICSDATSCTNATGLFEAFTQWFMARKQGILEARTIAQARGITGVTVSDGIEFNRVRETYPMVIDKIIPQVMPEYMTYSAWASSGGGDVNNPNVGGQLDHDLIVLAGRFPGNKPQLIIGELGPANYTGEDPSTLRGRNEAWQLAQNARAAQRAQLPANILWAAFDNALDPNNPMSEGLLSADGKERHVVSTLRAELIAGQRELQSSPQARIGGIRVTKASADGRDWDLFEMFIDPTYRQGKFPASLSGMVVRCSYTCAGSSCTATNMTVDGSEIPDSPARADSQSDFRLPHKGWALVNGQPLERWCTVSIPGMLTHGPKRLPP